MINREKTNWLYKSHIYSEKIPKKIVEFQIRYIFFNFYRN